MRSDDNAFDGQPWGEYSDHMIKWSNDSAVMEYGISPLPKKWFKKTKIRNMMAKKVVLSSQLIIISLLMIKYT